MLEPASLVPAFESAAGAILAHPEQWEKRNDAVLRLLAALPGAGPVGGSMEEWKAAFRVLKEPFRCLLQDLRSELVRDACLTLRRLAQSTKDFFRVLLRELLETMLAVLAGGNKVIKRYMDDCLLDVVLHCRYKGCIVALCERLEASRSKAQRESCARILAQVLKHWSGAVWRDASVVDAVGAGLEAGVADASELVRKMSRENFATFHGRGKECRRRAEALLAEAEPRVAAQLRDAVAEWEEAARMAGAHGEAATTPARRRTRDDEAAADADADAESVPDAASPRGRQRDMDPTTPAGERPDPEREGASPLTTIAQEVEALDFRQDDQVVVKSLKPPNVGTVRYIGLTTFATGVWIGVELPHASGKNNGTVMGETYFICADNHGLFVRPKNVGVLPAALAAPTRPHETHAPLPLAPMPVSKEPEAHRQPESPPRKIEGEAASAPALHGDADAGIEEAATRAVDFCRGYVKDVLQDMQALLDAADACGKPCTAPGATVEQLLHLLSETLARAEPNLRLGEEVVRKSHEALGVRATPPILSD